MIIGPAARRLPLESWANIWIIIAKVQRSLVGPACAVATRGVLPGKPGAPASASGASECARGADEATPSTQGDPTRAPKAKGGRPATMHAATRSATSAPVAARRAAEAPKAARPTDAPAPADAPKPPDAPEPTDAPEAGGSGGGGTGSGQGEP